MNILLSIDPVFAFLGNNYKVTTYHTTFISYVVSLILLEKEVKKPLLPNWPIKKVWKRVITHMALLPWTKPHGAFQFCFYRKKKLFFSLLSRLLEVTTSWHQFRLAVWHCSFGLLLSFSLPIPTKEIYSSRYIDIDNWKLIGFICCSLRN